MSDLHQAYFEAERQPDGSVRTRGRDAWRGGAMVPAAGADGAATSANAGDTGGYGDDATRDAPGAPDGVWATWSWDGSALTARTDRFGFMPLFVDVSGAHVRIAPSLVRLLAEGSDATRDDAALGVFLRLGWYLDDETAVRSIRVLPPGGRLQWSPTGWHVDGGPTWPSPADVDRDTAIDGYVARMRDAVERRLSIGAGPIGLALTGGRDSRHLLIELRRAGALPERTVTMQLPWSQGRAEVAAAAGLAARVGVPHEVVRARATMTWHLRCMHVEAHYGTDELWLMRPVAAALAGRHERVFDGIAGDVLSAGLFVTQQDDDDVRAGRTGDVARRLVDRWGASDASIASMLGPDALAAMPREAAIERIASSLAAWTDAANPVGAWHFWTRTRRAMAGSPFGVLASVPVVHTPFLDHAVVDWLAALPTAMLLGGGFHDDALRRAAPDLADVPFAGERGRTTWGERLAWPVTGALPALLRDGARVGMAGAVRRWAMARARRRPAGRMPRRRVAYLVHLAAVADRAGAARSLELVGRSDRPSGDAA